MTVATLLLAKTLWWFVLAWIWHKHLSLSYWGISPQYEDHSLLAAADTVKDNYWVYYVYVGATPQATAVIYTI
jgi:hypothetical protein